MLRNRIYYGLKPLIPRPIRMGVRRRIAARTRERVTGVWPIMPGSERPPEGWPGWPDGKKFALVLTHDVETMVGLHKCRELMELERELGFQSSFNFVPEGEYRLPNDLREELTQNGFEVGIHDLTHDGRLYRSRREFKSRAARINSYLRKWGTVGFRSAFMLHKLEWLHELDIQYDASTFDTNPFEPQPEGRHTIFPFWVPRADTNHKSQITNQSRGSSLGYVELPYTLPQDSTLFVLLREKTTDIWQRKLDWIAEHGGMALFVTHPDYMAFSSGSGEKTEEYPVELYKHLLEHVRSKYAGQYWQPLPREVAAFVVGLKHRPTNMRPMRVAMISHSVYTSDNRVRRYAEALANRGDHVDVFALRRNRQASKRETIEGVHFFRIQDRFDKKERSKLAYLWPLLRFLVVVSARLTVRHFKRPYDVLHIHNLPDFLVFSAWYPKLTGVPVVLDIHDIVPEFFMSKFRIAKAGVTTRLLMWMERASAAFADRVIIANHLWLEKYAQRTGRNGQCSVFINHVDSKVFTSIPRMRQTGKQIILYPGGLQWHQGLDIALHAFKKLSAELPTAEFHIYGDGSTKEFLVRLAAGLGLDGRVRFFEPRNVREIATIMANADLGVVPKRADSFGDEAYSTKIMEFMAVGVPVIVSSTKVDRYYFNDSVVRFFESGNADALAREMLVLLLDVELRKRITTQASEYVAAHCWENRKADYLSLVDSLCASAGRDARAGRGYGRRLRSPLKYSAFSESVEVSLSALQKWVEDRDYKGYDPGDGLTSFLRPLTFGNIFAERVLQQILWKSPINLRPLVGVTPLDSTKGRGFMAWGYLLLYQAFGQKTSLDKATACLNWLDGAKVEGQVGHSWGNHFDFTTRTGRMKAYTPTIVWSGLIGQAFLEAYEQTRESRFLEVAESICEWILSLPREVTARGSCLSYTAVHQSSVHNSNLLGAGMLARTWKHRQKNEYRDAARDAVEYSCSRQLPDDSWWYGEEGKFHWIDNFHTAYNLDSLKRYTDSTGDESFRGNLERGYTYFKKVFFEPSGRPRYYHNSTFPVDIQCAAQAIDTFSFFADEDPEALPMAEKVARWTIENMQDPSGYFYYRMYPPVTSRTPYFHWGQATMFKALAHLLLKTGRAAVQPGSPALQLAS